MEFLVHVADVIADRFLTDLETPGDLFVRLTDRHQLENLDFAGRESVIELLGRRASAEHVDDSLGDGTGHDPFARNNGQDAADDGIDLRVLEDVPAGARSKRLKDVAVRLERSQDEDLDLRMFGNDPPRGFDAVEVWHLQIHQHDVGLDRSGLLDHVEAVNGLGDDVDPRVSLEQARQTGTKQILIVGNQDSGDGDLDAHLITSLDDGKPAPGHLTWGNCPNGIGTKQPTFAAS